MGNCDAKPLCSTASDKILLQEVNDHQGGINCLNLSEDGSLLLTGSDDATIRLYATAGENLECVGVLEGHRGIITSLCVVDTYLLSASADKTVRKWDLSTCDLIFTAEAHTAMVNRLLFATEPEVIVSCSTDATIKLFSFRTGRTVGNLTGHKRSVTCIFYVPPMCFDSQNDNRRQNQGVHKNFKKGLVVSGSGDKTIKTWSISIGRVMNTFEGHQDAVTCLQVDCINKVLFSGSADKTIRSWRLIGAQPLRVFLGHEGTVTCIDIHKKIVYSGSGDLTVRSWAAEFGDGMRVFSGHDKSVNGIFLFQGVLFTACGDGLVRAFCARTGRLIRVFEGHQCSVVAVIATQHRLYSAGYDGKLMLWHLEEVYEAMKPK